MLDTYCCDVSWDDLCVSECCGNCGTACPAGTFGC
jgi:hypothetical protein